MKSMNKKILTIGIATYNAAKDIPNCLNSLLIDEVLDDIEILVVNDGSTDNIKEVMQPYIEKYTNTIRLINKENGGHGSTINTTIDQANGTYMKMVDADDTVDKMGFLSLIAQLKKNEVDVAMSPYYRVNINTHEKQLMGYLEPNRVATKEHVTTLAKIYKDLLVAMHSITYKTSLLRNNQYRIDEHCFYVDVEYSIYYLLGAKRIFLLRQPVYNYMIGSAEQSVNIDNMRARRDQHLKVTKSLIEFYEKERKNIVPYQESFLENNISNMILAGEYKLLMSLKSAKESEIELLHFDKYLKQKSPILYKKVVILNTSKKIRLLKLMRKLNFHGYKIVHRIFKKSLTEHL